MFTRVQDMFVVGSFRVVRRGKSCQWFDILVLRRR